MDGDIRVVIAADRAATMVEGAKRFALADRSDPFTLARALAHSRNGIAQFSVERDGELPPGYYDAQPVVEMRGPGDAQWPVTIYRNVARP